MSYFGDVFPVQGNHIIEFYMYAGKKKIKIPAPTRQGLTEAQNVNFSGLSLFSPQHPPTSGLPDLHRTIDRPSTDFQPVPCQQNKQCVQMAQPCQAELALGAVSLTGLEAVASPQGHRQLRLVMKGTLPSMPPSPTLTSQLPECCHASLLPAVPTWSTNPPIFFSSHIPGGFSFPLRLLSPNRAFGICLRNKGSQGWIPNGLFGINAAFKHTA